jgi:hypothetical protein
VGHSLTDMQPNIIVWDLETVPDLGGFAAANDLAGKTDVEVRELYANSADHRGAVPTGL